MSSMFPKIQKDIILGSTSSARIEMLAEAGLEFDIKSPDIDERTIIESLGGQDLPPSDLAEILARAKAETVSAGQKGAVVIGGDQVLSLNGEIFTKPDSIDGARDTLFSLRGKTHELHSCVAVALGGETQWAYVETAYMTMRNLSPEFIGAYIGTVGEDICHSVGAYEIEGLGAHLFEKVEGDHFTIRGMPFIPLLNYLYKDGVLGS